MMVAMMLPSLVPWLWRYRRALRADGGATPQLSRLILVGAAYFLVWTLHGIAIFPIGGTLASLEMQIPALSRGVPLASGAVVVLAGALQFTRWKIRHLSCCRPIWAISPFPAATAHAAWRLGLRLGLHCCYTCASFTAVLLVIGVMNLQAMAAISVAITLERLAPVHARVAPALGVVLVGAGLFLVAQAWGLPPH